MSELMFLHKLSADERRRHVNQQNRANATKRRKELRQEAIQAYGGACMCCGDKTLEFLQLDHIDGGGREHRKLVTSSDYWRHLKRENYTAKLRVLCANCHFAATFFGGCPHQGRPA